MEITNVGVIGAGTMGNGIAHVFAKGGYSVILVDVEQRFLDRGLQTVNKNLEREVSKVKITAEQRDQALGTFGRASIASSWRRAISSLRRRASASRSRQNSSATSMRCAGPR